MNGCIGFDEAAHDETEKLTAKNVVKGFRAKEFRALNRKGNDNFKEEKNKKKLKSIS